MKYLISILFILISVTSGLSEDIDFNFLKAFWNKETNTLDVILESKNRSIQYLFSNYEDISLEFNNDSAKTFEIHNVSKGLGNLSNATKSLPNKYLILLDRSTSQDESVDYNAFISEIIAKNSDASVIHLALMSHNISEIKSITKYNADATLRRLKNTTEATEKCHFKRIFKSFDIDQYRKIFLLTTGQSITVEEGNTRYKQDNDIYNEVLSKEQLGTTQIIPVSKGENINEQFFKYLSKLNTISTGRSNWDIIPTNKSPQKASKHDDKLLALKFKLTTEKRLKSNQSNLNISFRQEDIAITKNKIVYLNSLIDPVLSDTLSPKYAKIKQIALFGGLISLILYFCIPIYNRVCFKKYHVFTYSSIKEEGKKHNDPLKMSHIKDSDCVVKYGSDIMLLESWKYIKDNMSNPKYAKEYAHFFDKGVDGNIFTETTSSLKYTLPIWLASVLATLSSLVYIITTQNIAVNWSSLEILNTIMYNEISDLDIISNAFSLIIIFISTLVITTIINKSYKEKNTTSVILIKAMTILVFTGLCLALIKYSLLIKQFPYLDNNVLLILAIGIVNTLIIQDTVYKFSRKLITTPILIGLAAYTSFVILNSYLFSHYLSDTTSYFISSIIFLSFIGILIIQDKTIVDNELLIQIVSPPDMSNELINIQDILNQEDKETLTIGKNPNSDIAIKWLDLCAKDNHAYIYIENDKLTISPNNSELVINGQQIKEPFILSYSDEISLGVNSTTLLKILNKKNSQ